MSQTIITHDGKFHADDVFAVAALLCLTPQGKVLRTRDTKSIAGGDFVVDVGGVYDEKTNRFDHHQVGGAGVRQHADAVIPYAAFGLVWKKFGEKLAGTVEIAKRVDAVLVAPIDANDNGIDLSTPAIQGVSTYEMSDAIRAFIPTWQEDADINASFNEAVGFAKRIIGREIKRAEAVVAGKRKVEEAYAVSADKRLIVLDEDYSWKDTLAKFPEPLYVVHPQNETWRLYCVRDNPHLFANRKDLPAAWAGLRDSHLEKVTGVLGAIFAHRNRFMAVAKSKEGALALAKQALE